MPNLAFQLITAFLLFIAAFFMLVGALGLVRLPDFYMRLHAPTKAATLGVGCLLLASMLWALHAHRLAFSEVLITLMVFWGAPVVALVMAQAGLHLGVKSKAPVPSSLSAGLNDSAQG